MQIRDVPMGNEGRKGRLLVRVNGGGSFEAVHYRGIRRRAQLRVAACEAEGLKSLWEASNEVERRTGVSSDLSDAIGRALDLPALDRDVETIVRYLEETAT